MRRGLKEIDKIIQYYEPWIDDKRHKVPIKLQTNGGKELKFYTDHFKDDDNRVVKNGFPVLADLYEWIDDQLASRPELKWEAKIYITVKGYSNVYDNDVSRYSGISLISSQIEVSATAVEIGTAPDGKQWTRAPGQPKSIAKFDENIGYGFEKEKYYWKKDDPSDPGKPYSRALIDDTPTNRELLAQFAIRFDDLRDQFFRAFAPQYVHQFLSQTTGMKLLTGSDES